jgi:hypothetical protein
MARPSFGMARPKQPNKSNKKEFQMNAASLFADRNFRIECNDMAIFQEGDDPLVLRGPGEIWLDDDGQIQFKTFLSDNDYALLFRHAQRPRVAGQLISDDDYFRFEAQQFTGPFWVSDSVFPIPRGGFASGVATGTLHHLENRVDLPTTATRQHILTRFSGKLKFPPNQGSEVVRTVGDRELSRSMANDTARVTFDDFSFEVRIENDHTVVAASFPRDIDRSPNESRVREVLQFVLGREINPVVIETTAGDIHIVKLLSSRFSKTKGRIPPPVKIQPFDFGGHFWRLFSDYFRYAFAYEGEGWHPVSEHIGSAIESSSASLGSEILALSVAVEGIAGIVCSASGAEDASLLEDLDRVAAALENVEMSQTTRNRITGSLGSMRRPRNSDFLRAFVAGSGLPISLFSSWGRLRHAAAHGASLHGREIEEVIALRNQVTMLMYSLVFNAIGYSGPRTDYSLVGWPEANWPIAGPEPAPEPAPETAPEPAPEPVPETASGTETP